MKTTDRATCCHYCDSDVLILVLMELLFVCRKKKHRQHWLTTTWIFGLPLVGHAVYISLRYDKVVQLKTDR